MVQTSAEQSIPLQQYEHQYHWTPHSVDDVMRLLKLTGPQGFRLAALVPAPNGSGFHIILERQVEAQQPSSAEEPWQEYVKRIYPEHTLADTCPCHPFRQDGFRYHQNFRAQVVFGEPLTATT